ncbi:bifunctional UDP-N-acetylglucosamine diphosphorylase/glucosamine-1-phosphate N-acetyltransferase GlmU [Nitratireductor sp. ZSWI3]|uniref:bifunctional UDP-N-acetylglucosamine diphosphorylase/glucosamine-1-phosphate N-acetyltransferase GlmU n=1 Tax=Nitratireductor sp. ZSWI3 TaxID=2966359 RepID=UPI00214F8A2F|nr:bifunctional UDP-N-acetylglucosamine diphosphorylase/glucosamine-1-phosphate N-acetyltransferase GlmU [Nitratireductor sp. ZSWI3]MCR4267373.1 bifunctional UDP-N-acetylglucosamine diphosphorylase/glucosamine-1-phosphate N-acetyltransferase GlmU [Nitratireductor sp. ZSWI3]
MSERSCLSVILAAGEGTRMKSDVPKVLHKIAGLEMLAHVVRALDEAGGGDKALVIGHGAEAVRKAASHVAPGIDCFVQAERLGTGHAVLAARAAIARGYDDILVTFGDTPLIAPAALSEMRSELAAGADVVVMGFRTDEPTGYGRLIESDGALVAIREEKDCSPEERRITFCNGGAMAICGAHALALLDAVGNDNAKGEYYLTDIVGIAAGRGLAVRAVEADFESALGINNRAELAAAEAIWQQRRRRAAMLDGVTMIAPETVFFSHDTVIGRDTLLEPNVFFGPGVKIGGNVTIRTACHIEEAQVADGVSVGPFARLRPGAEIMQGAKIGNFVEVKKARVEPGAKIPHLSYVGDARVGARANLGAGTITCNYDGFSKHFTDIGEEAFIGTNSSLVAPLTIGAGAYIASGSVITEPVPADALAFGRARQSTREGLGKRLRDRLAALKAKKA